MLQMNRLILKRDTVIQSNSSVISSNFKYVGKRICNHLFPEYQVQ